VVVAKRIASSGVLAVVAAAMVFMSIMGIASVHAEPAQDRNRTSPGGLDRATERLCPVALREAEQRYHLPPSLLGSIAKAESGRPITNATDIRPWPWTIDADGTGLFFDSKAAAIAWTRSQAPRHRFIDVGCMQIDLYYHPTAFASLEDAFDPAANADYAARLCWTYARRGGAVGHRRRPVSLAHIRSPRSTRLSR
jgi:hypothetical protein